MHTLPTTPGDRDLLARISRWVRAQGWQRAPFIPGWWSSPAHRCEVMWRALDNSVTELTIERRGLRTAQVEVTSVTEAVDLLVALRVLPVGFSSGWRAGQDELATTMQAVSWPRLAVAA